MKDKLKKILDEKMKKGKKKGFTLVELLVVIAIIAVLATVSVVGYLAFTENAKKSVDEQLCTQYNTLLAGYQVLDDDGEITLGEAITYFEENGINTNYFNTSSSSYVFAYNESDAKCVLIDADSGTVQFPADVSYSADSLWTTMPSNLRLQTGVKNYTLTTSTTLTNELNTMGMSGSFRIDLNNFMLYSAASYSNTNYSFSLRNGYYSVAGTNTSCFSDDGTATEVKAADISIADAAIELDDITSAPTESSITFSNKYFGGNGVTEDKGKSYSLTIDDDYAGKSVTFDGCYFTNLSLKLSEKFRENTSSKLTIKNCEFYNASNINAIEINGELDLEVLIEKNKFVDCERGINLNSNNTKTVTIKENTFSLTAISSDKSERKDNAIQLVFDNSDEYGKTGYMNANSIIITDNEIDKALGFISIHAGFAKYYAGKEDSNGNYDITAVKNSLVNALSFSGNTIGGGISKTVADPGTEEDFTEQFKKVNKKSPNVNQVAEGVKVVTDLASAVSELIL